MNKKKELGKGLRALLSNIETTTNKEEKTQLVKELTSSVSTIALDAIEVNPFQPRTEFDPEELMELAKSIKVHGLIQPITVRSLGGDAYQLISGERRMRASKMAGLTQVPAYIRVANDQEMLEMALIENIQRSDLNAVEVAISYQRLIDECSLTHETLSDRVGKNRSTVTNYLRLLKLPPEIQNAIKSNDISMGHARVLAGVQDIALQLQMFKKTMNDQLSVRQLEDLSKSSTTLPSQKNAPKINDATSIELERIKKEISGLIGTKVDIARNNKGQGKIVIS
jgi:ParB family transcriptional regulator, chromosome partitioning protein